MKTTHLLIGLNVAIFAVMLAVGGQGELTGFSTGTLIQFGADYAPFVRDGQWWRLFTNVFIHMNGIHLAMNMVALYQVGVVLEPHYGRVRYAALYLLAGLGGSAASLAWNWKHPVVSAGASGAICGLIGAGAVAGHLLVGASSGARAYRDSMLRWLAIIVVYGFMSHVDAAAHMGGLVFGAGLAYLLDAGGRAIAREQHKQDRGLGLDAVLLLAVVGASFGLQSRHRDAMLPEEHVNRGVELARAHKLDEAMTEYRAAIRQEPDDAIAHWDLALALYKTGRFAECVDEAKLAKKLDPTRKGVDELISDAEDAQRAVALPGGDAVLDAFRRAQAAPPDGGDE